MNAGSNEWGLVDRATRRPVDRPKPGEEAEQQPTHLEQLTEILARRMAMLREKISTANHLLQEYRNPETGEDRGNACQNEIEQLGFILIKKEGNVYLSFDGKLIMVKCREHKDREGVHQCPRCKHWYCNECYELFLPIDPMFPQAKTALMCSQCHYDVYGHDADHAL